MDLRRASGGLAPVALGLALLLAGPAQAAWRPGVRSAIEYAHTRAGYVRFELRTATQRWGWHNTVCAPSASVLKAMLLVAYLDDARVRDRPLRPTDMRLIGPMIRRSDNVAAQRVLEYVGPSRIRAMARRAPTMSANCAIM